MDLATHGAGPPLEPLLSVENTRVSLQSCSLPKLTPPYFYRPALSSGFLLLGDKALRMLLQWLHPLGLHIPRNPRAFTKDSFALAGLGH
jgi:hypothetical protein